MNFDKYKHVVFSVATATLLLIGLFLLLAETSKVARADPGNLFVRPGGSGNCSQANPCDLQTALSVASDGDIIYLAGGIYTGSGDAVVTITRSITLYGGWDGSTTTPPVRNPSLYPTTIDGQRARRGVFIGGITVTLEGLTITQGMDTFQGAGLYARDAHLTLRHLAFYNNAIDVYDMPDTYAYGGGAMVQGGTLAVEASTFRDNSAWAKKSCFGGGLAISNTVVATVNNSLFQDNDAWHASGLYFNGVSSSQNTLILRNSTFVGNGQGRSPGRASGGYAGAIQVRGATARIEENSFRDNKAVNDYGTLGIFYCDLLLARNVILDNQCARTSSLYLSSVSPFTVTNNIIAGNQSTYTWLPDNPAVYVWGGRGQFLHNTIARNGSAYGVQLVSGAAVTLTNTILVSHTVGISATVGSTASLESTLWGSGAWANGTAWGGYGTINSGTVNVWDDPRFVNPAVGDYHLNPASAALNAGMNAGVTTDIDGDLRPIGAGYDIGADEYVSRRYLPVMLRKYP